MFLALMRKEARLLRPAVIGAIVIAALLYGIVCPLIVYSSSDTARSTDVLGGAAGYSLILTTVLAAVFACAALPTERRERWADFAAMLPVSRARATVARLLTAALLFAVVWGVHAIVLWAITVAHEHAYLQAIAPLDEERRERMLRSLSDVRATYLPLIQGSAAAAMALFGVAWLFASFMRSAAIAASGTIALFMLGLITTAQYPAYWHRDVRPYLIGFFWAAAVVGLIALAGGTMHLLRRVEP